MREDQAHPENVPFLLLSFVFRRLSEGMIYFFFLFSFFVLPLLFSLVSALVRRRPYFDWQQSVVEEIGYLEKPHLRCHGPSGRM